MRVTILLLTEDVGAGAEKDAHGAHAALVRAMLRLIEPRHDEDSLTIEPAGENQRLAMRANRWESRAKEDEPQRRSLVRSIATRICQSNIHFVLFHYDGDRPWQDREHRPRHAKFERLIVTPVQQLVAKDRTPEQVQRALSRLITIVPFYSVEAWLYQNTRKAKMLCRQHYRNKDVQVFEKWSNDRSLLDEETKPKELTCLRDKHHRDLAESDFPAVVVDGVGKSFHDTVERLRACSDLVAILATLGPRAD